MMDHTNSPRNHPYPVAEVNGVQHDDQPEADRLAREEALAGAALAEDDDGATSEFDTRPLVEITVEEHLVNEAALAALANDRRVFQRAGVGLVRVIRTERELGQILRPTGSPQIKPLSAAMIREYMAANTRFVQTKKTKDGKRTEKKHPPAFCVEAIATRGEWPGIRPLEGVVEYPVLRPDGTILSKPGYDPETGLIFAPIAELPDIPGWPTDAHIKRARADLLDLVIDFPFAKETHRATSVAAVLTVLARNAYAGPQPMFVVDANTAGSGKGLLVNGVSIVTTGRDVSVMSNTENDAEARKRITALAICGDPLVLIDNVTGPLGSAALDAALTSTTWKDRILGRNEMVEMPLNAVFFATGNNIVLVGDTSRRAAHIRLDSKVEKPEEREDFKYPNLLEHVRRDRHRYLAAGLTILRGFCAAGRPDQHLKAWGSYEGWTALVRSAVVWCGLPDPGDTRTELRERSDQEGRALRAIFAGIQFFNPSGSGIAVSEIIEQVHNPTCRESPLCVALREALMMVCPTRGKDFPSARSIGMKLHHLQGKIVAGQCLTRGERDHTAVWAVAEAQPGGD